MEERERVDIRPLGEGLEQMGEPDKQEQYEWDRGKQRVEGQSAGEERYVVFVGGLECAAKETGG
jgi:hypothetical protein